MRNLALLPLLFVATPALSADNPFIGHWTIDRVIIAPWQDPNDPIAPGEENLYLDKDVTIGKAKMTGPDMLNCGAVELFIDSQPYAGLFEGGLGENPLKHGEDMSEERAKENALMLGYTSEPVPTLTACTEIPFHLQSKDVIQFGLNGRIFTLHRKM